MQSSLKDAWHRDLVAHPVTHAWVLNLYRAGEKHPQTVADYFPHRAAPWPALGAEIRRHEQDEVRHVRMYTKAIERLGHEAVELSGDAVFNRVIRDCTTANFQISARANGDEQRRQLAHFLAHAHFLERRIVNSLRYHLSACEYHRRLEVAAVVAAILEDEERHVAYSIEAVQALLGRAEALEVLQTHRRGERRANLRFSGLRVRECLSRFTMLVPRSHRAVYAVAGVLMQEIEAYV